MAREENALPVIKFPVAMEHASAFSIPLDVVNRIYVRIAVVKSVTAVARLHAPTAFSFMALAAFATRPHVPPVRAIIQTGTNAQAVRPSFMATASQEVHASVVNANSVTNATTW